MGYLVSEAVTKQASERASERATERIIKGGWVALGPIESVGDFFVPESPFSFLPLCSLLNCCDVFAACFFVPISLPSYVLYCRSRCEGRYGAGEAALLLLKCYGREARGEVLRLRSRGPWVERSSPSS